MKKHLLLPIAILICFTGFAQPPNWDSVYADYFTKYAPIDTPAWLFPICFKNNLNEWDTVYLGHDNNGMGINAEFAEGWIKLDTSVFNAGLGIQGDSGVKVAINKITVDGFSIGFTKGRMPLTMYWNDSLFYSDSLPFPDMSPLPRAWGELWCNNGNPLYDNCPVNFPLYMSDSAYPNVITSFLRIDSIYFDGNGINDQQGQLLLYIVPYDSSTLGVDEKIHTEEFEVYPNPAENYLHIKSKNRVAFDLKIYSILGRTLIKSEGILNDKIEIDLREWDRGIYLIQIVTENNTIIKKIIRL